MLKNHRKRFIAEFAHGGVIKVMRNSLSARLVVRALIVVVLGVAVPVFAFGQEQNDRTTLPNADNSGALLTIAARWSRALSLVRRLPPLFRPGQTVRPPRFLRTIGQAAISGATSAGAGAEPTRLSLRYPLPHSLSTWRPQLYVRIRAGSAAGLKAATTGKRDTSSSVAKQTFRGPE